MGGPRWDTGNAGFGTTTLVLMADGTVQQVSTLRRGDTVTGITRVERYNRFVETTVESMRVDSSPMYGVEATATALIAASAQLVLTDRGWKHILGTGTGANQRPYLTLNNRLLGFTALNGPPVVTPAYRRGYLTGMIRGDGTIGTYTYRRRAGTAVVHRFRLALADESALERSTRFLSAEGITTTPFRFSAGSETRRPV